MTLRDRTAGWYSLEVEGDYAGLPDVSPFTVDLSTPAWMADARCRDADPSLFFPEGRGVSPEPARRICRGCSVRADCLAFAIETDALGTVMGGLSDGQRKQVRLLDVENAQDAA